MNGAQTYRGFPPEQQQLLRSRHLVVVDRDLTLAGRARRVDDARLEEDEGDRGYAAPRRLHRTVPPLVLTIESAIPSKAVDK